MKENKEQVVEEINLKKQDATYTKEQLISSKRYAGKQDLLNAVLDDSPHTIKETDNLIKNYLESEVK